MAPSKKHLKNPYPLNNRKIVQILKDIKNIDEQECYPKKDSLATILSHTKNGWLKIRMIETKEIFKIRNIPEIVESYDRICAVNNPNYSEFVDEVNEVIETDSVILESNDENIITDESYKLIIRENKELKNEIKKIKITFEKINNIIQKYNNENAKN